VRVRKATHADIPALGRLGAMMLRMHHEFDPRRFIAPRPGTEQGYGGFLGSQIDGDAALLVAEDGGVVVGYAYGHVEGFDYMSLRGPAGIIEDIIVDPAHRGRGIGAALLDAITEAFESRGAPQVVLSTAVQNESAQRLFERAGFRRTMIEMTRDAKAR
jgi:ribosomal protein S18 acetylase RimI-like enzyme